jgi:predicted RNA-binding Zn ribbon-like protein
MNTPTADNHTDFRTQLHSWAATRRYDVYPAPGGLALVQDFLNTRASGTYGSDMLRSDVHARLWARDAAQAWSAERQVEVTLAPLSGHDTRQLRTLRDIIDNVVRKLPGGLRNRQLGEIAIMVDRSGGMDWVPMGSGWRWLASAIWIEILLSMQSDAWQRLKRCPNPACPATFYDRSRNNAAVWHNAAKCAPSSAKLDRFLDLADAGSDSRLHCI